MASKAFQSMTTGIADTFVKGSKERRILTKFKDEGLNVNVDKECELVADALIKVALKVRQQWGKGK